MVSAITRRLATYRQNGVRRQLRIWSDTSLLELLRLRFRFDRWHARSPTSARPYRRALAQLITGLDPQVVVEVGCGLGAILARVTAPHRIGYDLDARVIDAAAFLHRGVTFRVGGLSDVTEPRIDVLIAVNWPHDFPAAQIEAWLRPLLPRVRYVLVDAIARSHPLPYRHYHDFAFLDGIATRIASNGFGEDHRQFLLYEMRR